MTALTRVPINPNFLHPNKFQLSFTRLPAIQFFCQIVNVPGISLTEIPKFNPFVELYSPGEKAIYDIFNVTFVIDEDLVAWTAVHDWIRALTFPTNFNEYKNLPNVGNPNGIPNDKFPQYSDATLVLLNNSNQPNFEFNFKDVFPTSLSTFTMSSTDTPETVITCDATFRFNWFDVKKL